jgi:hypothetical protein
MKTVSKWVGIILAIVLVVGAIAAFYLKSKFENLSKRTFKPEVTAIPILSDSTSLERGKVLAVACRNCHGNDYAGLDFFNDPSIGYMSSPNLTGASGSATEKYSDLDWIRTLRHAVNPSGKPLMVMPSEIFGQLSDQDLGCLIGYMKTIPKIEKPLGATQFTFMAKILAGAGMFGNLYPYDIIKHDEVQSIPHVEISNSLEYGAYFVRFEGCKSCHGATLNGGVSPDPVSPPGVNITPAGNIGKWTLDQFRETVRSGKTPEGKILDPKFMPWPGIGAHNDIELEGLFNYLKAQPALANSPELDKKLKDMAKK